jgi:NAD(P)-dependent dehydrogenase (short-subunit alcohol dehydrogenase family)
MEGKMGQTAVIAGVGPGSGTALVRKFVKEGCRVGMFARSAEYLRHLEQELGSQNVLAVQADVTDPKQVSEGFGRVREVFGPVDLFVHHASRSVWKGLLGLMPEEFESAWRVAAYGGYLCAREAVRDMLQKGGGTLLFTGATSSIRGRGGALDFSSAKFAVRGLAESLAREFWPKGIHVAHLVIDGVIDTLAVRRELNPAPEEPLIDPDEMAESYWMLVKQPKSAWSFEIDLRPMNEAFFV